jgi:hypothetical protein
LPILDIHKRTQYGDLFRENCYEKQNYSFFKKGMRETP